jgi:hypothetical protein
VGTLTIAGKTFTIAQQGALAGSCSYAFDTTAAVYPGAGGAGTVNLTTSGSCAWQAVSSVAWITITSVDVGVGSATLHYTVASNPGPAGRAGSISISKTRLNIKQQGV